MVPEGFVGGGRNACVEMAAGDGPYVGGVNAICQELRVIIWVGVTESLLGGVEEILTVKEDESPFGFVLVRRAYSYSYKKEPRRMPEG
jgi:hypothetical protein